jgi:signal transduction histidine kinase/CheY-like chemotaxis protein
MAKIDPDRDTLLNAAVLHWMQELAPQGILLTDSALNVVGWNRWLEERSGRRCKDVLGKNLLELYPDLIDRGLDASYKDALSGQVRLLSQRFHGYLLPMAPTDFPEYAQMQQSARISPLSREGKVVGTLTIIDDVTERVAREVELQDQLEIRSKLLASEKLARKESEEANRLKDEFLATISHELRTPLTAIVGWATLLRSGDLDATASARAAEIIYRNAHSQTQLISDLLDVSRIISNKLLLTVTSVNLPSVIEMTLEAVAPEAESKKIRIQSTIEPEFPAISGDADRLQQIIWNLLSNAIKFTPAGGNIHVRLRRVDSEAEISIADSGIGIDPQFLPHAFDRFRQANSAMTRMHGGLGLGLSIVRELVELHEGSAQVYSEGQGKGATFIVRLPIAGPKNTNQSEKTSPAGLSEKLEALASQTSLDGLKILVVDDEKDTRDFVRAVLEKCGSEVTTASSAAEALGVLETQRPDFLISDLGMPGEDGYSLIGRVRALPADQGGQTPALALTAYARTGDRLRVLRSGFQIHVPKPVEPTELIVAVASLAGRGQ